MPGHVSVTLSTLVFQGLSTQTRDPCKGGTRLPDTLSVKPLPQGESGTVRDGRQEFRDLLAFSQKSHLQ